MIQDSNLSKRAGRNLGVPFCFFEDILGILHGHWSFSLSQFILLKHCSVRAFLLRNVGSKAPCAHVEWSSFHVLCLAWKASLVLKKRLPRSSQMLDLVPVFQANRSKLEWKSWSKHSTLICSYINITPLVEYVRRIKTLPGYCNWILILTWRW